jgi:hypothetical protein
MASDSLDAELRLNVYLAPGGKLEVPRVSA